MHTLSGVSWHFVAVFGLIGGCVLAMMDRFRKRSEMAWADVAINGVLFLAILLFPTFGDFKQVLLALSLGWLIQAAIGLAWSTIAPKRPA